MGAAREFQSGIARIALAAAREHGFALAGGNALAVHGVIDRPTEDIDLFTAGEGAVKAAAGPVAAALAAAGYDVRQVAQDAGDLADVFYGFDRDMAHFEVSRGGRVVELQLVRFDRHRPAVQMDIGPVLHLDDLVGNKVAAMIVRCEPRDYVDVAAAARTYDRRQLLDLARRADPAVADEEIAEAMQRLDAMDDILFTRLYGLSDTEVAAVRAALRDWPR